MPNAERDIRISMIDENRKYFKRVLDKSIHDEAIANGETNLSYKATMSALLINLYRDEPITLPYQFLRSLVEMDRKIAGGDLGDMFKW